MTAFDFVAMTDPAPVVDGFGLLISITGGIVTVVVLAVTSLIRGWLIPAKTHNQMLELKDEQVLHHKAAAENWKEAYLQASGMLGTTAQHQATTTAILVANADRIVPVSIGNTGESDD